MGLSEAEYLALRQTIAMRGTVRMVLLPVTFIAWSVLAAWLVLYGPALVFSPIPLASVFPLAVLAAGFEAIHALHVGAERIGRYLQVFYEGTAGGPRWETTAMAVGPALPGGGIDPLFTLLFAGATALNAFGAVLPQPTTIELAAIGALHGAFMVRVIRARMAAARQRAVELESYRALAIKEEGGRRKDEE
jgi:hypothetical protein